MRELLHAAGSLAAGGVAGYLASGSVAALGTRAVLTSQVWKTPEKRGEGETERTRKKSLASTVCIAVRLCITCATW